ncbi:MAG: hypothetical protein AB7S26_41810 [Sandaracinaceae bacterium]
MDATDDRPSATSQGTERLVLGAGIAGVAIALSYAASLIGEHRDYFLYYNVPIAAPFAAFLAERLIQRAGPRAALIDASVVALALSRVFVPVPFCSGHALFCGYATLSAQSRTGRLLDVLVLVEVIAIKVLLWHDFATLTGGLAIAALASLVRRWCGAAPRASPCARTARPSQSGTSAGPPLRASRPGRTGHRS